MNLLPMSRSKPVSNMNKPSSCSMSTQYTGKRTSPAGPLFHHSLWPSIASDPESKMATLVECFVVDISSNLLIGRPLHSPTSPRPERPAGHIPWGVISLLHSQPRVGQTRIRLSLIHISEPT